MNKQKYLEEYVKISLKKDNTGHNFEHTKRVLKNALKIAKKYKNVDLEVLTAACWLHDISYKYGFVENHHLVSAKDSEEILLKVNFSKEKITKIKIAIEDHVGNISAPIRKNEDLQTESKILRDADNLDALGKIGLKRNIDFCKSKNMPKFISVKDGFNDSLYGSVKGLLSWPDRMLTKEGKKLGKQKLKIMKLFLKKLEARKL